MIKIIEQYQDMAGKWRVLVDTGSEIKMLKFQKNPAFEIVEKEINKPLPVIDKTAEIIEIDRQILVLQEKKILLTAK